MEIKPVGNLLTASALRARSRAVELSKKEKRLWTGYTGSRVLRHFLSYPPLQCLFMRFSSL